MNQEQQIVDLIHRTWTVPRDDWQDGWHELAQEHIRNHWPELAYALDGLADLRFIQGRSISDQKVNRLYRATHPPFWRRLAPQRAKAPRSQDA